MLRRPPFTAALLCLLFLAQAALAWNLQAEWRDNGLDLIWSMDEQPASVTLHGRSWLTLALEGAGTLGLPGQPALPLVSRLVELPAGSGLSVELLDAVWQSVPGDVLPEQEAVHTNLDLPTPWRQDPVVYKDGQVVPAQNLLTGEPALLRGVRLEQVGLVPARSLPGSHRTELLRTARIRVTFAGVDNRNNAPANLAAERRPELLPADILTHPLMEQEFDRTANPSNPGAYLVLAKGAGITGNAFFTSWVAWKRQKGHVVTVVGAAAIPTWTASAIKSYIQTAVTTWDEPPVYVALVGDHGAAGDFSLPTSTTGLDGEYDHYYACVVGTDYLGDVAVGRLSCENATQLGTMLNKTLYYETTPAAAGSAWLGRAAMATGWDAISMIQQTRTIARDMIQNGITTIDTVWYPSTTASWVNGRFNAGISLYNYRGWISMDGVTEAYINNNANFTGTNAPTMAAIFTCATGDLDGSCETEAFVRKGDVATVRGASAAMGFATANTHTAYNNAICGGFWSAFLDRGETHVGAALLQSKAYLVSTLPPNDVSGHRFSNWANLIGDPGMEMWCGVPAALAATLVQGGTAFALGASELQVRVTSGGNPVTGALVCLWQSGLQSRGVTDASGTVWLSTTGAVAGTVNLTATKADFVPSRVNLTASAQTFPRLVNWNIPGDGKLQPGETVPLLPTVQNTGVVSLTSLALTATSLNAGLTLGDATATWPTITAGAQAGASTSLSATAATNLADATSAQLGLAYTSGQGSFTDGADLLVSAPLLQPGAMTFTPGGAILDPGTTAALALTVTNSGGLAASGLTVTLSAPADPFLTVTSGSVAGVTLAQGGSTVLNYTVQAATGAVRGHRVAFTLDWSGMGLTGSQGFTVVIGTATAQGPTGPDAYGYRAIESVDANTLAPAYSWLEIAPAAGGTGSNLNLTDTGNELDDAATVTLPFTFVYYGVSYTQMAVCSNGFVAFETNAVDQTDYRNHLMPSALGPDAMIAPMWDDHYLPAGAGVFVKNDAANHRYIVEWYLVQANGTGGVNTFQLVLVDPAYSQCPGPDGDFLYQYMTWNNTQSNSYDFPGCTVGMKDETSSRGLNLTNYLINDPTVQGFGNGRAVLFTTAEGAFGDGTPPSIALTSLGSVQPGDSPSVTATISDASGVAWATLYWREGAGAWQNSAMAFQSGETWLGSIPQQPLGSVVEYYAQAQDLAAPPNSASSTHYTYTVVAGNPPTGPDARGYRWYDSGDAPEGPDFSWLDISGMGSNLNLTDDVSTVVTLPFPIVYWGTSYTQLSVCSNGFVIPGNNTDASYTNTSMATGQGIASMICGFWDDLNPGAGGQVRAAVDLSGTRFVVAWIGVPRYGTSESESFELIFLNHAVFPTQTGDTPILAQYQTVTNATSCTTGHQNSARTGGISYLYNGTLGANASAIVAGQSLLLTTGATPLPAVTGLTASTPSGSSLLLNWNSDGAPSYRVYAGATPWVDQTTLETTVTGLTATLPISQTQRFYQVRGVREYMATGLGAARAEWLPVEIVARGTEMVK